MEKTMERKDSRLRVLASELIHGKMGRAPFLAVRYSPEGALAQCVWQDGVREYLWVEYSELMYESQHERAMAYIREMPQEDGNSLRSRGTSTSSPGRSRQRW